MPSGKTHIDWNEAKRLFESGATIRELAAKLRCHKDTVQIHLAKLGCNLTNYRDRQNIWRQENRCSVTGYRLLVEWNYIDPWTKVSYSLPTTIFLTRPYPNGEFRSALYPGHNLLIPRALLRRAIAHVNKKLRDEILLGRMFPNTFTDDGEQSATVEDNNNADKLL